MDKNILDRIVKEEIKGILEGSKHKIRESVKNLLLPEMRRFAIKEIENQLRQVVEKGKAENIPNKVIAPSFDNQEIPNFDNQEISRDSVLSKALPDKNTSSEEGKYLYGVVNAVDEKEFNAKGINMENVTMVTYEDLGAIVHGCTSKPYQSDDDDQVREWVLAHQNVINKAYDDFGMVIPATFDTIIAGKNGDSSSQVVKRWLKDEYEVLKEKIKKFQGCAEYGVQVIWELEKMADIISMDNKEIRDLKEKIKLKSKGTAYMYMQKFEGLIKKELENRADRYFREFYKKIAIHTDKIKIDKTKSMDGKDRQMIMNLACLLPTAKSNFLGDELEMINQMEHFHVLFTGPWPPYSFA